MRFLRGTASPNFLKCENAKLHSVDGFMEEEDIRHMDWNSKYPDLNLIEHVWDSLARAIAGRHLHHRILQLVKSALLEEWDLLPSAFLDIPINSMTARCAACILSIMYHVWFFFV